ncbi:MAG TPA: hypothetical protein VIJ23_05210, partial [Mycobacterium sp.]
MIACGVLLSGAGLLASAVGVADPGSRQGSSEKRDHDNPGRNDGNGRPDKPGDSKPGDSKPGHPKPGHPTTDDPTTDDPTTDDPT